MFKYLYSYPSNIFNGDTPVFELESLKDSQVKKAIVFAGKPAPPLHAMQGAVCYLYLEVNAKLEVENIYKNLRIYENLLCLVTGKPGGPGQTIDISKYTNFDEILKEYGAKESEYNKPGIQHHGMVKEYNVVAQLPACVNFLNRMNEEHRKRSERALSTFIIAEEIGMTVNPHTKATVRASLYLAAINQLADNPELCPHKIDECPVCHKKDIQHQKESHFAKMEELMRELFTGDNVEAGVKLIKEGYHKVRSPFIHDGILSGGENEGGWIADDPANLQFLENLVNYTNSCRRLILLYIQKRATEA